MPVRRVVPFGPGGSGDIVSRIVADERERMAGQPFIVDNKPGATAMIGTATVKNAPADGYTLLHGSTSSLAASPSLYKQMTYDPATTSPRSRSTARSRASGWPRRTHRKNR